MIATLYKLPSWIMNQDNKPSLELFNLILENSASDTLTAKTTQRPTYTKLVIQATFTTGDIMAYNYVNFDGNWFMITDIAYLQDTQEAVIYEVTATIDVYLSFIVSYFSEDSQEQKQVFFKQKHLNRWMYDSNNNPVINFSQQFYLRNKHKELNGIGSVTQKIADSAYNQLYNGGQGNSNSYSLPIIEGVDSIGYLFAIWKITSNTSYSSFLNNWTSMGLVNITQDWNVGIYNNNQVPFGLPANFALTQIGSDAYVDWTILPVPIDIGLIYSNGSFNSVPITNIGTFSGLQTINNPTSNIPSTILSANDCLLYPVEPQNLIYILYNPSVLNSYDAIQNIFNNEPYLLQYCSLRVRGAGEDSVVDVTGFNNWTVNSFMYTMYSFTINLNHPNTQLTNTNLTYLKAYTLNSNEWLEPYEYNLINDAWWTLNWKSIYPSSSNNWNNYMLNNANQYHMGLNIAHYNLQAQQADVGFNTAKVVASTARVAALGAADMDPMDYLFGATSTVNSTFNAIDGVINSTEQLTNSIFSCMSQSQEYQYQLHGKKGDMSRTANERLAVSNNIISYNNFALSFVWEQPIEYEQQVAYNYIMFNGYILERWLPLKYWYNRKYINYVKIAKFTDTLIYNLNSVYKTLIDNILNRGMLIWTSANGYLNTLPYSDFTYQAKDNTEINQDNNEVNFLNQGA